MLAVKPPQLLQRIERARRVVSLCSQATIRAYDEEALLSEACRILLDVGDYCMAWIGEASEGDGALRSLAHAGAAPSGVRAVHLPWANDVGLRSPTARAIREQRPQVLRGVSDAALLRSHPEAEILGYAAVCAFPVQFGAHGVGALTIYAREAEAFAPEEVSLLRELAGDLAVGVAGLRAQKASAAFEEKLEAAERRFHSIIENAPVGILQIAPDGQIILANLALTAMLGFDKASDITSMTRQQLEGHLDEGDLERLRHMVAAGTPYPPLEMRVHNRTGDILWVAVQAQVSNGGSVGVTEAFVRDLGPQRAAQLANARLATVAAASDEAIIGIDPNGAILTWSPGAVALYGYAASEAVGRDFGVLLVPVSNRQEWNALLDALVAGQRVPRFETLRNCKMGETKEVSVAAGPILDGAGIVVGASLLEHDVGPRNRYERTQAAQEMQRAEVLHLQELNRTSTAFMNRASHELNTPLTPVLLQVQALQGKTNLDADLQHGLAIIERNVKRLAALVKDLVTASGLEFNPPPLLPATLDLSEQILQTTESFRVQAHEQGVTLTPSPSGPLVAFADGKRVAQVLFNFVGNALKFTPRGGTVTIAGTRNETDINVVVTDTGMGFGKDDEAKLFRPFSRVHEHLRDAPPGTGLGLFISKGLVEEMGGRVWVQSAGPGKGATFGFSLPTAPAPAGRGIRSTRGFPESPPLRPAAESLPFRADVLTRRDRNAQPDQSTGAATRNT